MDKTIYLNSDTGRRITESGAIAADALTIYYQEQPNWIIQVNSVSSNGTVAAANISDGVAWQFSIDKDFSQATDPMCRTLDANINKTDTATGKLIVSVDAYTAEFLAGVGTAASVAGKWELKGFNSAGRRIYYFQFGLTLGNIVDPDGATPLPVPDNLITEAQLAAILTGKLDKVSAEDIEFTGTAGLILPDRTTGIRYRFYLDNGQFIKEDI